MSYHLQSIFDLRQRNKEACENIFAKEQQKTHKIEQKLLRQQALFAQMKEERLHRQHGYYSALQISNAAALKNKNSHLIVLLEQEEVVHEKILEYEMRLLRQKKICEEALEKMLEATIEFKALLKHKEKWEQAQRNLRQKKEEEILDDISLNQFFAEGQEQQ